MIQFVNPQYLYLLIAVPVIAGLWLLARMSRRNKLRRFGRSEVLTPLMPEASRYTGWIKISLELLALVILIIAIARPIAPHKSEPEEENETVTARGIELMICLDVSNSMLASSTDDKGGVSRLRRAKFILDKLIDKLKDDKIGLIVFAGESYTQLPITSDYISAKMFLDDLSTEMVQTQGTAIGTAIDMAMNSFTPDSEFDKAIVIITDCENFEDDPIDAASRAAQAGIQIDVIGLGTSGGAPIPTPQGYGTGKYMTDQNGQVVVTAFNESLAKQIAQAGNGIYLQGANPDVVNELDSELDKLDKAEYQRLTATPSAELFPLFAIVALLLLAVDTLIPYRKISWLRGINFFSKASK